MMYSRITLNAAMKVIRVIRLQIDPSASYPPHVVTPET